MSTEAARAFYEKIKTDASLAKEIVALGETPTDDDMVRVANSHGFACTAAELDQVGMEVASELDDSQLDAVAGGADTGPGGVPQVPKPSGAKDPCWTPTVPGGDKSLTIQPGTKNLLLKAYKATTT